jgi:coniferyl-aldehyde dehydrogenase
MSEYTPSTTAVVRTLLSAVFPEEEAAVVGGSVGVARAFCALPFDHLVFTGSPAVAPEVARAAATHLTPLTLELGGKSPALLGPQADLAASARRIVHGKTVNAGQTCVAPDYALVPRELVAAFAAAAVRAYQELATATGEAERTAVSSDRQLARLSELIADARDKGATVTVAGAAGNGRRLPLHVVTGVRDDMRIAREELFGPILPVIAYDSLEQALLYINARPRPLALYPIGLSGEALAALLRGTHSGGVTVDDWGWHVFNHDLPFGGSGGSGMGSYHGVEGFRELSHQKAVFRRQRFFPMELFYPPYGRLVQRLVLRYYLGRPPAER